MRRNLYIVYTHLMQISLPKEIKGLKGIQSIFVYVQVKEYVCYTKGSESAAYPPLAGIGMPMFLAGP